MAATTIQPKLSTARHAQLVLAPVMRFTAPLHQPHAEPQEVGKDSLRCREMQQCMQRLRAALVWADEVKRALVEMGFVTSVLRPPWHSDAFLCIVCWGHACDQKRKMAYAGGGDAGKYPHWVSQVRRVYGPMHQRSCRLDCVVVCGTYPRRTLAVTFIVVCCPWVEHACSS